MACSLLVPWALGHGNEGYLITGSPSVQSTTVRTGTYAAQYNGSSTQHHYFRQRAAGGTTSTIFQSLRCAIRFASLHSTGTAELFRFSTTSNGANNHEIQLANTGIITVLGVTGSASSSNAFSADNTWHLLEFDAGYNAGSGLRVFVDGVLWVNADTATFNQCGFAMSGFIGTLTGTLNFFVDDLAYYDSALPDIRGRTGWRIVTGKATADVARGNWTAGAGGTTSIFDACDNIPPVGVAVGSATNTSQAKNVSTGANSDLDLSCESYQTIGVSDSERILAVQAIVNHAPGTAVTIAGAVGLISNPNPGTTNTFDYGDVAGAGGTFPAQWNTAKGPVSEDPSVTRSSAVQVRTRKTTNTANTSMADFVGYAALVAPTSLPPIRRPYRIWRRAA